MIKYKTNGLLKPAQIKRVEVTRETAHFVYVYLTNLGQEVREAKKSDWTEYHDTWADAHAALIARAESKVNAARSALELAEMMAEDIKKMREEDTL